MKNRNQKMGGTQIEAKALNDLEKSRKKLLSLCNYQNEKNWVGSAACMNRISLSKILFYEKIITQIKDIPGVIIELGVQWGALTSILYNLTSILEPFNFRRKIIGFDTFSGFPDSSISNEERQIGWEQNSLSTSNETKKIAERNLNSHQAFSALPHMKRHELVEGDVMHTLPAWFKENPHETVALCIFDMDLGAPTKKALKTILKHVQKGTILLFDEYNHPLFPEEGKVARELLDIHKYKPLKSEFHPYAAYVII